MDSWNEEPFVIISTHGEETASQDHSSRLLHLGQVTSKLEEQRQLICGDWGGVSQISYAPYALANMKSLGGSGTKRLCPDSLVFGPRRAGTITTQQWKWLGFGLNQLFKMSDQDD